LQVELLEDRLVPATLAPTAVDQLFLEQLNDARANPAAYGQSIGLDLSGVAPSQPLAWDARLVASAQGHSQDMNDQNYFAHTDPAGNNPGMRMANQGYAYNGWGESIAAGYTTTADALKGLIIDAGIANLGHRRHLLAMDATYQVQSQVGIGIVQNGSGTYSNYYTIDTAQPLSGGIFLTGAVFNDLNNNGKYDIGEGLGGVTVTVQGGGSTTSFASGGYSIKVNPGTYTVTASGGTLSPSSTQTVTIGTSNQRLQIIQGKTNALPPVNSTPPPVTTAQHNANVAVVNQLFSTYLKRTPTTAELNTLAGQLDQGQLTAATLTSSIKSGQEYKTLCTSWLTKVYSDMLGRPIVQSEIDTWLGYLKGPGTMDAIANAIVNSQEHRIQVWSGWVQDAYQTYLRRTAGGTEVLAWVNGFQVGWTQNMLVGAVVGSAEYQNRVGSTNSLFVAALYRDMLGRTAATTEVSAWVNVMGKGATRTQVVAAILGSAEYRGRQNTLWVGQLYSSCLGRPAVATEFNAVMTALNAGVSFETITNGILTSAEYYYRASH